MDLMGKEGALSVAHDSTQEALKSVRETYGQLPTREGHRQAAIFTVAPTRAEAGRAWRIAIMATPTLSLSLDASAFNKMFDWIWSAVCCRTWLHIAAGKETAPCLQYLVFFTYHQTHA